MKRRSENTLKVSKLPRLDQKSPSPFELLLRSPGYHFILEHICGYLKTNDLISCHQVSKGFHALLKKSKHWYIGQLYFIIRKSKICRWPKTPLHSKSNFEIEINDELTIKNFDYFQLSVFPFSRVKRGLPPEAS